MNFLEAYKEAFLKCYPQKTVALKRGDRRRVGEVPRWFVVINGDKGDRAYTQEELVAATRDFLI